MSKLTVEQFLESVHHSGLLDRDHVPLETITPSTTADAIAETLVGQKLLTRWQARNLLAGKRRGFVLGNYRLLDHLGTGGMSSVYLGHHRHFERQVAIKVFPNSRIEQPGLWERFLLEGRSLARLSHPNIVRVLDLDEVDDTRFLVMEFVDGTDLKVRVLEKGPLSMAHAAEIIRQTAAGLQHAHERGFIHRDMKPANVMLTQSGRAKILDLGLARSDDQQLNVGIGEEKTQLMGTADYLAPEQATDAANVDHRADLYGLGCTWYFLLAGHPPFAEGSIEERIQHHRATMPMDIRAHRRDCPHALASLCMQLLAKKPQDRIASAGMVAHRLERWLEQQAEQPQPGLDASR